MNDLKLIIHDVLAKVFWSLCRSPIVWYTLFCTFVGYELKCTLVSSTIPKCLWVVDDIEWVLIKI